MAGIPTKYANVWFRSRLEARWAAFFDLLGWPWEYEPIDLQGYIPDFILTFKKGLVLVEVKPVLEFGEFENYLPRIREAGWTKNVLLVGGRLFSTEIPEGSRCLGLCATWRENEVWKGEDRYDPNGRMEGTGEWEDYTDEALVFRCSGCGKFSYSEGWGAWICARCDASGKEIWWSPDWKEHAGDQSFAAFIDAQWAQAGNLVQWKGVAHVG